MYTGGGSWLRGRRRGSTMLTPSIGKKKNVPSAVFATRGFCP
jgi:hypothetical protein